MNSTRYRGANPGGDGGSCPPHDFEGGGHNIKCPPHEFACACQKTVIWLAIWQVRKILAGKIWFGQVSACDVPPTFENGFAPMPFGNLTLIHGFFSLL